MFTSRTICILACAVMLHGAAASVSLSASRVDALLAADNRDVGNDGVALGQALDDLAFLRKATIDMVGRIPTHTEIL